MKYSVIVLLDEQHEDFPQFIKNLNDVFLDTEDSFEILLMANGTGGFLRNHLDELQAVNDQLRTFEFSAKTTQAVCLKAALNEVSGDILVVCGSYQQITNDFLIKALKSLDEKTDIVAPWRQKRVDPSFNQFQSRVFNILANKVTGFDLHDLSCTVKIFRREVLEETELYGNMSRFLPILAARKGFITKEVPCEHLEERGKTGFYSLSEYINRLLDIFTLYFNTRFTKKPLRFFSSIGLAFLLIGLGLTVFLFIQRFLMDIPIGNRPLLFISLLLMILGILVSSVGLLGEIVVFTHGRNRKEYTVEKTI